ncbi:hypothetical protein FRACA_990024 [Frankia canadensis]|uniref:Uncharacterized protein n=1 Tax=Frankia canadensis TaxID=1836972 RepID=A0A2I2L2X9_9ACTN|nr:hypothetical protein FRACA_990024 [Frankia canadensis]SOU59573.1 hypothetical protein FRACA_990024 [Frankia canadensis]
MPHAEYRRHRPKQARNPWPQPVGSPVSPRHPAPQSRIRLHPRGPAAHGWTIARIGGIRPSRPRGSAPHAHAHIIGHVEPMGYAQQRNRTVRITSDHIGLPIAVRPGPNGPHVLARPTPGARRPPHPRARGTDRTPARPGGRE